MQMVIWHFSDFLPDSQRQGRAIWNCWYKFPPPGETSKVTRRDGHGLEPGAGAAVGGGAHRGRGAGTQPGGQRAFVVGAAHPAGQRRGAAAAGQRLGSRGAPAALAGAAGRGYTGLAAAPRPFVHRRGDSCRGGGGGAADGRDPGGHGASPGGHSAVGRIHGGAAALRERDLPQLPVHRAL